MIKYINYFSCIFKIKRCPYPYHYLIHKRFLSESIIHIANQEKLKKPYNFVSNIQPFSSEDTLDENPFIDVEKSSIFYMLNENDQSIYNLLCPFSNSDIAMQDSLLTELQNSLTVNDVFEALEKYPLPLSVNQACQTIFSLFQIKNARQFKYKNSLIHFRLDKDFYSMIGSHPQFLRTLTLLIENVDKLSSNAAVVMMCLNNLNVELSNELMVKLHLYILGEIHNIDKYSLMHFSFVFVNKGLKGYYSQIKILSEINKRLKNINSIEDLYLLSLIYQNMRRVISKDIAEKYAGIVESFIREKKLDDSNSNGLLIILKTLNSLFKYNMPLFISKHLFELLSNRIQQLTPQQLVILNFLFLFVLEPKHLLYKIQECASKYIDECSSTALKADLLLCLSINSPFNKKMEYEAMASELITESQPGQDFGSLYKTLRFLKSTNYELCDTFWTKALENTKERLQNVDNTIGIRERILYDLYKKYMFFNDNVGGLFRHYKQENEIKSLLKAELETPTRYIPTKLAHMIAFLISYSNELSENWYDLIKLNVHQLNEYDVGFLSKSIEDHMKNNVSTKENMAFLSRLKYLLDCCTEEIITNKLSLQGIVSLTTAYINRQGSTSGSLLHALGQEHMKYLSEMNSKYINQMVKNFFTSSYLMPEIFEAVTDFIIENEESVSFTSVHKVVNCLYRQGFTPTRAIELAEACQNVIESDCERMPCHKLLQSCIALSFFKPLSSDLIHYIFCVEFLDQLEDEISAGFSKNYNSHVRTSLMVLNRIVCLDNPEEKIPWFHEKYCRDKLEMRSTFRTAFHRDVSQILALILGNENLICSNKASPYYYHINMEFALNEDGTPISPFEQTRTKANEKNLFKNNKKNMEPYKRVAILLRGKQCYSTNNLTLTGPCQMTRKHLEMLGYAVVDVPEYAWYSMSISNKENKYKLLKSLIYKELLKIS